MVKACRLALVQTVGSKERKEVQVTYDNATESNKVYEILVGQRNKAVTTLNALMDEQARIDASVEDYNRIVLAITRSIAALTPSAKRPAVEMDEEQFQRHHDEAIQDAAE